MTGTRRWPPVRRRRVILTLLLLFGAWLVLVGWSLLSARSAMRAGQDEVDAVRHGATAATLLDEGTARSLERAEGHFADARRRLRSPILSPLRVLPVAGRHVRAADHVVGAARQSTALAADAVAGLQGLSDRKVSSGPERVTLLRDLSTLAERTRAGLAAVDPGSPKALWGPLADAVVEVRQQRDQAIEGLDKAVLASRTVGDLLAGPDTYLLVGANNAEMRNGTGMFLSVAPLHLRDGRLDLGDVRPGGSLVIDPGQVEVTGDMARNWPWLDPGSDPRQLALSADFPQSGPIARSWWRHVPGGGDVAGVIVVDVDAMRELLRVVGPVEVDGIRYDSRGIRGELLKRQYQRAGDEADAKEERRDRLGDVARAVFDRLEAGHWKIETLSTALVDLVQRRHLLVWSADRQAQQAWVATGAAGQLRTDSLSVATLNRGAEKLDAYVRADAAIATGDGRIDLTYTLTNEAPAKGPRYQLGPNIAGLAEGEHRGIVVVNLPKGSTDLTIDGARLVLRGRDGPTEVIAGEVTVARGQRRTVRISARLPAGLDRLTIEPSARIPRTRWTVDGHEYRLDRRRTVAVRGSGGG